ncbi:hypothetical protein UFOVP116_35 [uncultured Caudovirales phage]|uniref:IrrE N-terminal-like domain-containing protein n=1 Tax=uncultured Caudovirales phage TaxID=2100421 RepID=A0A6J5L9L3_9CAUD|nr:hypothetical protein UFOVP116_35 [uncultured Caudovirales phage]
MRLFEFTSGPESTIHDFTDFVCDYLKLKTKPKLNIIQNSEYSADNHTFGHYNPSSDSITVQIENRQIVDVLRTLAHELVHYMQDSTGQLHDKSGETGSEHENEANSVAGVIMRLYTEHNPELFNVVTESKLYTFIARVRTPQQIIMASVMAPTSREAAILFRAQYGKDKLMDMPRKV